MYFDSFAGTRVGKLRKGEQSKLRSAVVVLTDMVGFPGCDNAQTLIDGLNDLLTKFGGNAESAAATVEGKGQTTDEMQAGLLPA